MAKNEFLTKAGKPSKAKGVPKNYKVSTEGLKRYKEAVKTAKAMGGAYAKYVKDYYSRSKKLRSAGVKIKQTGARVMTYDEFMTNAASERIGTGRLISEQFGALTGNQARKLRQALSLEGFDISLERASVRQLSASEWKVISNYYEELKAQGLDYEAAAHEIAANFFGS